MFYWIIIKKSFICWKVAYAHCWYQAGKCIWILSVSLTLLDWTVMWPKINSAQAVSIGSISTEPICVGTDVWVIFDPAQAPLFQPVSSTGWKECDVITFQREGRCNSWMNGTKIRHRLDYLQSSGLTFPQHLCLRLLETVRRTSSTGGRRLSF